MGVNFLPTLEGYVPQQEFRFWCQRVLPLVYDDSLSYYELLNKVVQYLNIVIENVGTMEENIDSLYQAYNQLQEWVNTYFDNLDVQEEINNKLDVMASDGTLSELLNPFIPNIVTNWLEENVDPVGSAVVVDRGLTISGAAADAKVTGDALKGAEQGLSNLNNITNHAFSGGVTSQANSDTDIYLVKGVDYKVKLNSNITSYCSFYVIGDSVNAIYLSNNNNELIYHCGKSGQLRLFPNNYTGNVSIDITTALDANNKEFVPLKEIVINSNNIKDKTGTYSVTSQENYVSDIYVLADVDYIVTLESNVSGYVSFYSAGDSANAVYLSNNNPVIVYKCGKDGFVRLYPSEYTGNISLKISTNLIDATKDLKGTIFTSKLLNNGEYYAGRESLTAGTNRDTNIPLVEGVDYVLTLKTNVEGYISAYVPGDSANVVYLSNNNKRLVYHCGKTGYLRFFPSAYTGNANFSVSTNGINSNSIVTNNYNSFINKNGTKLTHTFVGGANWNTGVILNKGVKYYISSNKPITSYLSNYISGDTTLTAIINASNIVTEITPNIDGELIIYSQAYSGELTISIDTEQSLNEVYEINPGDSIVTLLNSLRSNKREKTIYINEGEYDIYADYQAAITAGTLVNPTNNAGTNYDYPYNAVISHNTKIIGRGNVVLKFLPESVTTPQLNTWSVLNVMGSVYIENINIIGQNCRYLIHDDDKGVNPNTVHIYKKVNLTMLETSLTSGATFYYVTGFGFTGKSNWVFDSCNWYFNTSTNRAVFYGHNQNSGVGANITVKNCGFRSNASNTNLIRLQTLSVGENTPIKATFGNCYINGKVRFDLPNSGSINSFDVVLIKCGNIEKQYSGSGSGNEDPREYTVLN